MGKTYVPTMREIAAFNKREEAELRAIVQPLCEDHGYGRIMQLVSKWWAEKDPIGALTVGPPEILKLGKGARRG